VRFLRRLGQNARAEASLNSLALLCQQGMDTDWEFTEWAHGNTGRPMGKAFQAWSAASYVAAYIACQGDTTIEVCESLLEELPLDAEPHGLDRGDQPLPQTVTPPNA
jgi:hypothetical protein